MRIGVQALFCSAMMALACSDAGDGLQSPQEFDAVDNDIIRATSDGGRNAAVMVYVKFDNNGYIGTRTCSGSYIAPRVVLTAAHCLDNAYLNQVNIYFGEDFETDYAAIADPNGFVMVPPPGSPSKFAHADSFESHPEWDPAVVHPDMGVVYLDRKLPFAPMPLARFRIDHSYINKEASFSGWGADTVTGPVSATGSGVQRTGRTKIVGSPTAADYYPEDPNPGMLDPNIRKDVLKTSGAAPYSNGCFGDSGGPLFVNKHGRAYIAGVSYWTGLYCEDYNLYTRIDPFLPFLDKAIKKGGQEAVRPTFHCVAPGDDGQYTAFFGYSNKNGVSVTVPYGQKNKLALDPGNRRPELFAPGVHEFDFAISFDAKQTVTYTLSPENGPSTTLKVNKHSKACGAAEADEVECAAVCDAQFESGCAMPNTYSYCLQDCLQVKGFFTDVFPDCADEYSAYNACLGSTPSGEDSWLCDPDLGAYSLLCGEQEAAIGMCLGG